MQERLTDVLGSAPDAPESDDEAFEQVRERVQALISAARTLSDTCADLADALRPAVHDDPLVAGFGRLRAERTAALLDEAASAARGTLGLLHSAYGALDRGPRIGPPAPRSGATTWPEAFVEVPPRAFTVDDEAGTALDLRAAARTAPAVEDATDPHGIPAVVDAPVDAVGSELGLDTPDESAADVPGEENLASDNFEGLRGWASPAEAAPAPEAPAPEEAARPDIAAERSESDADVAAEFTQPEVAADPEVAVEPVAAEPEAAVESTEPEIAAEPEAAVESAEPEVAAESTEVAAEPEAAVESAEPEVAAEPEIAAESTEPEIADAEPIAEPPAPDQETTEAEADAPAVEIAEFGTAENHLPAVAPEPTRPDPTPEHAAPEPPAAPTPEPTIAENAEDSVDDDPETLDGEGLRSWATFTPRPAPAEPPAEEAPVSIGAHSRHEAPAEDDEDDQPEDDTHTADDVDGEGLRSWAGPAQSAAALAGWMVVDPDDADDPGHPIRERTVAAAHSGPAERLTVGLDDPDGPGWHGDTVSAEPRSLSLVPPVLDDPTAEDPWATEPTEWSPPDDLSGAAAFARPSGPVWAAEPAPGASAAGDGVAVFPIAAPEAPVAEVRPPIPEVLLEEPAAATISRQVEAARRHLQAALVVANGPAAPKLGALLTAVEQVLTAVTDLARETRGLLESGLADRTFPGEARFLCSPPWDGVTLVGRDAYGDDGATPAGLAKLLRALGYEAHSATSAGGMTGVQIRAERYAMQVALVEPAGGGRQRWSGALEWVDSAGANRTWAETLGPAELEDEELARRVDELLRRSIGSV